jgi:hypothetical protein
MPGRQFWATGSSAGGLPEGSGTSEVVVDFGHAAGGEAFLVVQPVEAAWVTESSRLTCSPSGQPTDDHDPLDAALDGVTAYVANISPGVGFDLVASASNGTWGRYPFFVIGW